MRNGAAGNGAAQPVQSVDRALAILEILARRGATGVTELGAELGVHKSTASRLLATLEQRGLVEQLRERGLFRLGFGLVRLAGASAAQLDLTDVTRAVAQRLAADLDETVNVAVLDGVEAVNVSQVNGSASIGVLNWVGRRTPLHATASGKVLLAFGPGEVAGRVLAAPLERFTPATVGDAAVLERELAAVRERGWAATVGELEAGLNAVAAPLRAADGRLVAAMSVSGPSYRLRPEDFARVAARLCAAAAEAGGAPG
ncbi:IclR family transcriptional regulator [Geodermatophilus ruber]|uniref:Glycerol operon regulatory protein n=1 Tax=Geodermatophilus ruber TaxID=504800 RepID=A0A1I4H3M0_9ACTN|nr:IclR family transcriptional regulator [Geodermatophilus ruber]SFL36829.1 transcriptional regulator, IclR family [Geodermatophilus ruber]